MLDNGITLVGNLTDDPQPKVTASGVAYVTFRLACSRRIFDRTDNQWRDGDPAFFSVIAWRQLAQNVGTSLRKGDRAVVIGRVRQSRYEKDGEKRVRSEVEAEIVGAELAWSCAQIQRKRAWTADAAGASDGQGSAPAGPGEREGRDHAFGDDPFAGHDHDPFGEPAGAAGADRGPMGDAESHADVPVPV
jgi:single-strand DNA-binding protein